MAEDLFQDQEPDLLAQLEERVVRALEAVSSLKKEKASLQKEVERLEGELAASRSKSKQAASRISRLLEQMETPAGE